MVLLLFMWVMSVRVDCWLFRCSSYSCTARDHRTTSLQMVTFTHCRAPVTAELLSLQIDVLCSVYFLTVFTATANTSQLFSILFDEDEIKTRVACKVGVGKPQENRVQNRRFCQDIFIRQIVKADVYWKPSNGKCGCHGN